MPFIQFPFIEVPKELHEIVGEPTPGTRAYRREGTHAQCGEWFEVLGEYYKGDVGLSTNGVILFVPVSRAGVHKRIKEGKLTAFFFYVTGEETTLFGAKRKAKQRPYIAVSVSECKAWAAEIKRKVGYVDEPNESPIRLWDRLRPTSIKEEPKTSREAKEADEFANIDPKDKGNRKVKYRDDGLDRDIRLQDWYYLMAEVNAAISSGEKAEKFRKRLKKGREWDKEKKNWKWKDEVQ